MNAPKHATNLPVSELFEAEERSGASCENRITHDEYRRAVAS